MPRTYRDLIFALPRKLAFYDALVLVYIAAFVREYLWIVRSNPLAWFLTVLISLLLFALYLAVKEPVEERRPRAFWLIVALPLLFIFLWRFAFPDLSFDVLNYHIFHSERALRGWLYVPGDFAPAWFPYMNPVPDLITGIFRYLLGYRLGTAVNFLAMLWTGAILYELFRDYLTHAVLRSVAVLLSLMSEQLLFEINNYMVDLLGLPLLLQATVSALRDRERFNTSRNLLCVSLLLGAALALKLTNLVFVAPIGAIVLIRIIMRRGGLWRTGKAFGLMAIAFAAPGLPHMLYLYRLTGSPVFPYYNKIFKSTYWPLENIFDGRWGPKGAWETVLWPFRIVTVPERLSELNLYSGRMALGLIAALLVILLVRKDIRLTLISLITIAGGVLWSTGTGYIRYGLMLEVLGGVVLVGLAAALWQGKLKRVSLRTGLAGVIVFAFLAQSALGFIYAARTEWSGRPTAFAQPRTYRRELRQIFVDRALTKYLTPEDLALLTSTDVWLESSYKTNALAALLKPQAPFINMSFAVTPASTAQLRAALTASEGKKVLSLAFEDEIENARAYIQERSLTVLNSKLIAVPYFSHERRLHLVVFEVDTRMSATKTIFNAQIVALDSPVTIRAGQKATLRISVKNISGNVWLGRGTTEGKGTLNLGNKWLDTDEKILVNDDARAPLPHDVSPGQEVELKLTITAPTTPGDYFLMLDMVQEGVTWFHERYSSPAKLKIRVEP